MMDLESELKTDSIFFHPPFHFSFKVFHFFFVSSFFFQIAALQSVKHELSSIMLKRKILNPCM